MCTPLHYCCLKLNRNDPTTIKVFKLLLEFGADVNIPYKGKDWREFPSTLHLACKYQNDDVVVLLIEHGANVKVKNRYDKGPSYYASEFMYEAVLTMLEMGADVPPLYRAVRYNNVDLVVELLKLGADPDQEAKKAPLIIACRLGHEAIADILLNHGMKSIDIQHDIDGYTALCCAVKNNSLHLVEKLIEREANVNHEKHQCPTPLLLAKSFDMFKVLINAGADLNKPSTRWVHPCYPLTFYCLRRPNLYRELGNFETERKIYSWVGILEYCDGSRGSKDLVRFIKNYCDSDVNFKDERGKTVIDHLNGASIEELLLHFR